MQPTTIGLDLAKTVFQVHGVDGSGKVVVSRRLRRDAVLAFFATLPPCLVGMEACAGAHFWAREITRLGHRVRLMPPQHVIPMALEQFRLKDKAQAFSMAWRNPIGSDQVPLVSSPTSSATRTTGPMPKRSARR